MLLFFSFSLKSRNSITIVPIDMKPGIYISEQVAFKATESSSNFYANNGGLLKTVCGVTVYSEL